MTHINHREVAFWFPNTYKLCKQWFVTERLTMGHRFFLAPCMDKLVSMEVMESLYVNSRSSTGTEREISRSMTISWRWASLKEIWGTLCVIGEGVDSVGSSLSWISNGDVLVVTEGEEWAADKGWLWEGWFSSFFLVKFCRNLVSSVVDGERVSVMAIGEYNVKWNNLVYCAITNIASLIIDTRIDGLLIYIKFRLKCKIHVLNFTRIHFNARSFKFIQLISFHQILLKKINKNLENSIINWIFFNLKIL